MLPLAAAPVAQAQPVEDKCPLNAATMDPAQLAELFPECVGAQDQAPEIDPDLLVDLHDQNPVQQDQQEQQEQQEQAPVQQEQQEQAPVQDGPIEDKCPLNADSLSDEFMEEMFPECIDGAPGQEE